MLLTVYEKTIKTFMFPSKIFAGVGEYRGFCRFDF